MSKISTFVDNVGRVIIGEFVEDTPKVIKVKEPAVVNVQVNQENGQISVQLLPFIFREFVKKESRETGVEWTFVKQNLVTSDNIELDDAILNQYKSIFNPEPVTQSEPETVKLFDDED